MTYSGGERRRAVTSPVRARRRAVTSEVLKHVKGIELRARNLVNTLFTGEYRSVFRGQGIEFAEVREYQQGEQQAVPLEAPGQQRAYDEHCVRIEAREAQAVPERVEPQRDHGREQQQPIGRDQRHQSFRPADLRACHWRS